MNCCGPAVLWLCCAFGASAQTAASDLIVLPAGKTETDITLPLRTAPPANAKVNLLKFLDSEGAPLSPKPAVVVPGVITDPLKLHLSEIYFWGEAKLKLNIVPGSRYTYTLQRGPALDSTDLRVERQKPVQLWLYNFETQPLNVKWRIVSGAESVCGIDSKGQPRADCASFENWPDATLGPARGDPIAFVAPDGWFNPWKAFREDVRQAQLEIRFGNDRNAPLRRVPLDLHLDTHVPSWVAIFLNLTRVIIFVTLGAILLMLAQVMIPNFRRSLRMKNEIEGLQQRLRAVGNGVGGRLYTRCHQELTSVRTGLAMGQAIVKSSVPPAPKSGDEAATNSGGQTATKFKFLSRATTKFEFVRDRVALAGNTAEVNRLASILARIESRIRLTERLAECRLAILDSDLGDVPASLCWNRDKQLRNVERILSTQFITKTDEKIASASLDLLADAAASIKDFAAELETRIFGIRRQFAAKPWKDSYGKLVKGLNGCKELLEQHTQPVQGGWTIEELILRDLAAVRLAIVSNMIAIEKLLNEDMRKEILQQLQSSAPAKLAAIRIDLLKLSEGFSDEQVNEALVTGMWDAMCEPTTATDQDVIRASLVFRNKDLNRCTAKNSFQCDWCISLGNTRPDDDVYESGWEVQFIPERGKITLTPEFKDADGKEVKFHPLADPDRTKDAITGVDGKRAAIPPSTGTEQKKDETKHQPKGVTTYEVGPPTSNTLASRVLRGFLDALITAVVPVITVALTQVQNGGDLGIDKLVLLGFTSQAIRAVVVPESVSATPDPQPAKTPAEGRD